MFVGRGFAGSVDAEIDGAGMLVAPGFIDTHIHAGYQCSHRLITDVGRPDYFGQPFLEFNTAKKGKWVGGDPRYWGPAEKERFKDDPWAAFTAV